MPGGQRACQSQTNSEVSNNKLSRSEKQLEAIKNETTHTPPPQKSSLTEVASCCFLSLSLVDSNLYKYLLQVKGRSQWEEETPEVYLRSARNVSQLCNQKLPFGNARENKRPLSHQLLYLALPAVTPPSCKHTQTYTFHSPPPAGACVGSMFQRQAE